jgi:hypothetical protein
MKRLVLLAFCGLVLATLSSHGQIPPEPPVFTVDLNKPIPANVVQINGEPAAQVEFPEIEAKIDQIIASQAAMKAQLDVIQAKLDRIKFRGELIQEPEPVR